jgi:excinuclease ABC subunit C
MTDLSSHLKNKISNLPDTPGAYMMKDRAGEIIYVGKALSLKKRVSSYFTKTEHDPKTSILTKNIRDIEYIITDSEIEALILESTLIKEHQPKFNVRLKDDKRYPYIAITLGEDYPRVIFTRKLSNHSNRYFGPYTDAGAARKIVHTINRIFKLKTCKRELPLKKNERPCINFQMKRCQGICQGRMSRDEYGRLIETAVDFLNGNIEPVQENLKQQMDEYSHKMEYEKAARIRDIISDIQKFSESQKVYAPVGQDQDYVALSIEKSEAIIVIFEFRSGALLGRKISIFENAAYSNPAEIIKTLIVDYYIRRSESSRGGDERLRRISNLPQRIITQYVIEDKRIVQQYLSSMASKKITIATPKSSNDRGIINMILKNIETLKAERESYKQHLDKEAGLNELMSIPGIDKFPEIIECFDISNLQGKNAVASMVRFRSGMPDTGNYRRYRIRGYDSPNDPGMIHEVLGRRIQHLINEGLELPDLIVIDGGRSQLSRAYEIARDFNLDTKIISLAKRFEEVYHDPSQKPVMLPASSRALKILQNVRDEAHRFAIAYHQKIRDAGLKKSILDGIPNIGKKKKTLLLQHLRSVENIKKSSIEELKAIPGIGEETAREIYHFFHGE